MDVVNINL